MAGAGLIFSVAVLTYGMTLRNNYVLDDFNLIVGNDFITKWDNVKILVNPYYLIKPYPLKCGARPLTVLSLMVDHALFKNQSWGYHATNVFLHGLNSVMVLVFIALLTKILAEQRKRRMRARRFVTLWLKKLFRKVRVLHYKSVASSFSRIRSRCTSHQYTHSTFEIAMVSALIFALHPVQAEVVNIPSFRADLLVTFFYVLSLICFILGLRTAKWTKALISAGFVSFVLGLFSKEIAITLPLVSFWLILLSRTRKIPRYFSTAVIVLGIFSAIFLLSFWNPRVEYFTNGVFFPSIKDNISPFSSISAYLNTMSFSFLHYVRTVLIPYPLSIDYLIDVSGSLGNVKNVLLAVFFLFLLSIVVFSRNRLLKFGLGFYFIAYIPVSNIVPLTNTINDRYMYLLFIGLSLILSIVLLGITDRHVIKNVPLNLLVIMLVFYSYGFLTIKRNYIFNNGFNLYGDAVNRAPKNARVQYNFAVANLVYGRYGGALHEFNKLVKLNPMYRTSDVYYLMGVCDEELGNEDKAKMLYVRSLLLKPDREILGRLEALNQKQNKENKKAKK